MIGYKPHTNRDFIVTPCDTLAITNNLPNINVTTKNNVVTTLVTIVNLLSELHHELFIKIAKKEE